MGAHGLFGRVDWLRDLLFPLAPLSQKLLLPVTTTHHAPPEQLTEWKELLTRPGALSHPRAAQGTERDRPGARCEVGSSGGGSEGQRADLTL